MAATGNWLTLCLTPLVLLRGQTVLGGATGFFIKAQGAWHVATNWHVLSGRAPTTGQPRHSGGAVPDACIYSICHPQSRSLNWKPVTFGLGDALAGTSTWFEHPIFGQEIDIAAFPISDNDVGVSKDILDPTGSDDDMWVDLGGEVFVPGYPLGKTAGGSTDPTY